MKNSFPLLHRILVFDPAEAGWIYIRDSLASSALFRFEASRAEEATADVVASAFGGIHAVILSIPLPGHEGLSALHHLKRKAPDLPVIAIFEKTDWELVREALKAGAADAIHRAALTPELLWRAVGGVIELQSIYLQAQEDGLTESGRLRELGQPSMAVSSSIIGERPLKETDPQLFQDFVDRFVKVTTLSLSERIFQPGPSAVFKELRTLADDLSKLGVGPQVIVNIYREAISTAWSKNMETKSESAHREEARMMALGLMGHVLSHYRLGYLSVTRARSRGRASEIGG